MLQTRYLNMFTLKKNFLRRVWCHKNSKKITVLEIKTITITKRKKKLIIFTDKPSRHVSNSNSLSWNFKLNDGSFYILNWSFCIFPHCSFYCLYNVIIKYSLFYFNLLLILMGTFIYPYQLILLIMRLKNINSVVATVK